jgi:hypothetical protein
VRQPSRSLLNTPLVRKLLDKLRGNDSDMMVLKMKKYLSDPDTPPMAIDAALEALEECTICESLYIQVRFLTELRYRYCLVDRHSPMFCSPLINLFFSMRRISIKE